MKKRVFLILLALVVIAGMFAGCSSAAPAASSAAAMEGGEVAEAPAASMHSAAPAASAAPAPDTKDNAGYSSTVVVPDTNRMIILTQSIVTRTKNFDEDLQKLETALKTAGGYLENANIQGTKPKTHEDEPRTAAYTFRVPKQNAESFVKTALAAGEVVSNQSTGQDITSQYTDTEARLKTQRTRLDRLETLLTQATKMADIVTLEEEISKVTYEIESMEGQKRNWDNLVQYVTVNMTIEEVNTIPPAINETKKQDELSFGEQLGNGFLSVLRAVVDFFKTLLLILVAGSPIIVPVAAIVLVVIFSVRASKKKKQNKTNAV